MTDSAPDSMGLAAVAESLALSLSDARNRINSDPDALTRYVRIAAADMHRVRPRLLHHAVVLTTDEARYAMPGDALRFHSAGWTYRWLRIEPWDRPDVLLPRASIVVDGDSRWLDLAPAPCSAWLGVVGSRHTVHYHAQHTIDADGSSIASEDRNLLILRAQAEAMKEIALNNSGKPGGGAYRGGDASLPRNSTASAVYQQLMAEFERS